MMRLNASEREHRIREYFPLVRRIAKRVQRIVPLACIDDLVGDGSIGLIRAVDTYDSERGFTFQSYARKVIVGTMLNGLRRMDPIPERVRRRVRKAEDERYRLAQERGAIPPMAEMERATPGLHHARTLVFRYSPLSLTGPLTLGEKGLLDFQSDPIHAVLKRSQRHELLGAIALLSERQRKVLLLYYYRKLSMHAIGMRVGVSPQRVSQLHLSALHILRSKVPRSV